MGVGAIPTPRGLCPSRLHPSASVYRAAPFVEVAGTLLTRLANVAVDRALLTRNLHRFYDFTNQVVLFVGAGGNQLFDPATRIRKLIAIDPSAASLHALQRQAGANPSVSPVEVLATKFEDVRLRGDVVYFEFCLHEIAGPLRALEHAKSLAPDIVVFDHSPHSPWVFHAAEENLLQRSSEAIKEFGPRSYSAFRTEQRFATQLELLDKVRSQGPTAVQRAQRFVGAREILIPMDCELVLL
jgi:hypothetical protein